jgi:hypothetical protein
VPTVIGESRPRLAAKWLDSPEMIAAMKQMGRPSSHATRSRLAELRPHSRLVLRNVIAGEAIELANALRCASDAALRLYLRSMPLLFVAGCAAMRVSSPRRPVTR